jgi:hypothetical protein
MKFKKKKKFVQGQVVSYAIYNKNGSIVNSSLMDAEAKTKKQLVEDMRQYALNKVHEMSNDEKYITVSFTESYDIKYIFVKRENLKNFNEFDKILTSRNHVLLRFIQNTASKEKTYIETKQTTSYLDEYHSEIMFVGQQIDLTKTVIAVKKTNNDYKYYKNPPSNEYKELIELSLKDSKKGRYEIQIIYGNIMGEKFEEIEIKELPATFWDKAGKTTSLVVVGLGAAAIWYLEFIGVI